MATGKVWVAILLAMINLGLVAPCVVAGPSKVIIIRHGEKPLESIGAGGNKELTGLAPAGKDRAIQLARLFSKENVPDVIYAMHPGRGDDSTRPHDTVKPLADALGYSESDPSRFNNRFTVDELDALVKEVQDPKNDGKTVLICWEHKRILGNPKKGIGSLVEAFGYPWTKKDPAHPKWDTCDFDRMLVLSFNQANRLTAFLEDHENINGQAQQDYAAACAKR